MARRFSPIALALGVACERGGLCADRGAFGRPSTRRTRSFSADFAKGDANAVAAHYTAAGWAFPLVNGEIAKGREAITKVLEGRDGRGHQGDQGDHRRGGGSRRHLRTKSAPTCCWERAGRSSTSGKYIVVWKRDGGQWKLHRDIWNTSMPAPK